MRLAAVAFTISVICAIAIGLRAGNWTIVAIFVGSAFVAAWNVAKVSVNSETTRDADGE